MVSHGPERPDRSELPCGSTKTRSLGPLLQTGTDVSLPQELNATLSSNKQIT